MRNLTKRFHKCDDSCKSHISKVKSPDTVKNKIIKKTNKKYIKTDFGNIPVSIANVYDPNYSEIDDTIEDIKKISRLVSTNHYSTNNVYLILQDALKKIILAEK